MKINYITSDAWWDTDKTLLPFISKEHEINIFVSNPPRNHKYKVKEPYGSKTMMEYNDIYWKFDPRKIWTSIVFFRKIYRVCRDKDCMNLLIVGGNAYLRLLLFLFLPVANTIVASHNYIEHGKKGEKSLFSFMKHWFYKKFRKFVFFSELQLRLFENDYKDKQTFLVNIPLKDFGCLPDVEKSQVPTFLFFGMIRDYKRLDLFIEAANHFPRGTARFLIAGFTKEWDEYKDSLSAETDYQCDIKFIDDKDVASYYAQAHYLVLPYDDATQSGPSLIALNYAIPIIATDLDAFKYIIQEGYNGFLFPKGDAKGLQSIMEKVVGFSKTEYDAIKENCRTARRNYIAQHDNTKVFHQMFSE